MPRNSSPDTSPSAGAAPAWALWLAALSAALLSAYFKIGISRAMPSFDAGDDTAYFHVESALQYRYAKLLAAGSAVPAVDTKAQYPEGLRVGRDVSLLMERATAATWRLAAGGAPRGFHRFVIVWVAAVSSLSVPALFALGLTLGAGPGLSLCCAFAYAVSWAAVSAAAGTYAFSDFALPLLLISLAGVVAVLVKEGRTALIGGFLSAAALALALDAWHFSRFFLVGLWLALAYAAWNSRRDQVARKRLLIGTCWILAGSLGAGLCSGTLRETHFLTSPELMLGVALAATLWKGARGAALGATILAAGIIASRGAEAGAYGHVYGLLYDKLRFGLLKPENPLLLSSEGRLLWTGPFNSPDAGFLFFSLFPLIFLGVPRLFPQQRPDGERENAAGDLCDGLLIIYLAGALLVSRLMPVLAFFAALVPLRRRGSRLKPSWVLGFCACVAAAEGLKTLAPQSRLNPFMGMAAALTPVDRGPGHSPADEREALRWLSLNGEGRPVLADFGVSASVLAYTPSPVLLQPKFESGPLREKTAAYLKALYSDEETFDAYCRKYGAKLFLYSASDLLDETPDGPRYMAAAPPLSDGMAAVLFQFHPEALKHFRLVFENGDYRIFEEGLPGVPDKKTPPIYDLAYYRPQHGRDGRLVLDISGVLARRESARTNVLLAMMLERMGRRDEAQKAYSQALSLWPQ